MAPVGNAFSEGGLKRFPFQVRSKVMGVTIHFEGRLRSKAELDACIHDLRAFAKQHDWALAEIAEEIRTLARVQNEENWDYTGRTKGLELQPHPNSDPFRFEVDEDLYIQEYCKTQFSPVDVHIALVKLLRHLSRYFDTFTVVDEGEFFDSNDVDKLIELRDGCFYALDDLLKQNPESQGPVRMGNGRIVDFIS